MKETQLSEDDRGFFGRLWRWGTALIEKRGDALLYLIFGALTTLVDTAVYWFMAHPLGCGTEISTVAAWVAAVLFAYLTNRKWVFHSQASTPGEIVREAASFFGCRVATGLFNLAGMTIFVGWLGFDDMVMKILLNILVIILNYVFSKLLVFRRK